MLVKAEHKTIQPLHNKSTMEGLLSSPLVKSFLAGSFSGTCSTVIFQPFDLVKTRLQSPVAIGSAPNSMIATISCVIRNERIVGLWKGMSPSISRTIPGVGMYFSSLHWLKSTFGSSEPGPMESVVLGALARSLSGVLLLPITVIKTRFESGQYQYKNIVHALVMIHRTEGAKGLYSGLGATLMRDAPFSGLYLMFYTQLKKSAFQRDLKEHHKPLVYFMCGVMAGSLASVVTQPADVIKTHMQLYPDRFSSVSSAIMHIYKTDGVVGFMRGIIPRCLRRTLMAAMAWTVYEQIMKGVGMKA
ncbi:mitochondrial glycine transporter A-like [Tubulanus polymorphus]|uniref:mitochondrial glycine transporter A-like n=1 Tax=Tubulanus polymorphus TaxID=672921 RepID=UPI003DA205A7